MEQILLPILFIIAMFVTFAFGFNIGHSDGYMTSIEERQDEIFNNENN